LLDISTKREANDMRTLKQTAWVAAGQPVLSNTSWEPQRELMQESARSNGRKKEKDAEAALLHSMPRAKRCTLILVWVWKRD